MPPIIVGLIVLAIVALAVIVIVALLEHYFVEVDSTIGEVGTRMSLEPH